MVVKYKNVKVKDKKTGESTVINPYTPEELAARAANPQITPQFTQQATGQTKPGVFNSKTKAWESQFTPVEQIGNKQMLEEKQKAEVEKFKMENMQVSPESAMLAEQQRQEIEELDKMLIGGETATTEERNVQAGQAAVNAIIQTFGGEAVPIEEQQARMERAGAAAIPGKVLLTALGKAMDTRIAGFSLSDLFSKSNVGNIKELTGDANKLTTEGKRIAMAATSRGADVQQSINSIELLEEAVRQRYTDATVALSASPSDIAEGVDFTEELVYNLRTLAEYRQALERYKLTGDKNHVLVNFGSVGSEVI